MAIDLFSHPDLKVGVTIKDVAPFFNNRYVSGNITRRSTGVQYFELDANVSFEAEKHYLFDQWMAVYRFGKPFTFPLSKTINYQYRGNKTALCQVSIAAIAGQRGVKATVDLEPGTRFTFANHAKVYTVEAWDASTGTLNIFPNLRTAVPSGTIINYRNPVMSLIVTNGTIESQLDQIVTMKVTASEAII
ncbi:hypothetical protein [Leclercia sp. AS011]|uniref:hypothetical protein n=1 Tax=Leclercia sp. AS011 TaxID=3081257 RepID=UPI003015DF82